jgi:hypothetical protein
VNLRLRWIEHVGIHFANNVKHHSSDGDKHNQQPAHRSGAQSMVRGVCKAREFACSESTNKLVDTNTEKIETYGQEDNSNPSICHSTEKSFSHACAARKCRPAPVNNRSRLEENLDAKGREVRKRQISKSSKEQMNSNIFFLPCTREG